MVNGLAVCAGVGGIDLGLRLALGKSYRTVAYIERDAFAASTLVARMADSTLDQAPVWDDLATFDGCPWRGVVDLVSAGFPCQPNSVAGQRKGTDDERWIWPAIAGLVREVGPRYVFLENVRGLLAGPQDQLAGVGHVLRDLAALGFDAEWLVLGADDVGAPHIRKRVFILAHTNRAGCCQLRGEPFDNRDTRHDSDGCRGPHVGDADERRRWACLGLDDQGQAEWRQPRNPSPPLADTAGQRRGEAGRRDPRPSLGSGGCVETLADPDSGRQRANLGDDAPRQSDTSWCHQIMADTDSTRRQGDSTQPTAPEQPDAYRGGILFPPARNDHDGWRQLLAVDPSLEPSLRRDFDELAGGMDRPVMAYRLDRLRAVGNGCVPLAAGLAYLLLADRLGVTR